jgi:hypothetical protein
VSPPVLCDRQADLARRSSLGLGGVSDGEFERLRGRAASFSPSSGCGITARMRCMMTASNDASGNVRFLASMTCAETRLPA